MKMTAIVAFLLLLSAAMGQQPDSPTPSGSIYGIAIGTDGQPAKNIGLTATPLGMPLAAVLPHTVTNERGEYRFKLSWWGKYTVYAEDKAEGYSNFSTGSFGQTDPATVEITPAHPEAEMKVHLPPKAVFLTINLTNEQSGAAIPGMDVTVMRRGNPPSLIFSEGCSSTEVILLPPNKDLLLHIASHGFREWSSSAGNGYAVHSVSGSRMTLDVKLAPSD
jgi:hypothetical protein